MVVLPDFQQTLNSIMRLLHNGTPMQFCLAVRRCLQQSGTTLRWKFPRSTRRCSDHRMDRPIPRPLLVIADSRGRVRCWDAIRKWPYMRDVLALCSTSTPQQYRDYLRERKIGAIVAGDDHIDMRPALEALNKDYGVKTVRVDSGGTLNSVLLQAGVVDEVSVLVHPYLAGGLPDPTMFDPHKAGFNDLQVPLAHVHTEVMGNGIVWLRYLVEKTGTGIPER